MNNDIKADFIFKNLDGVLNLIRLQQDKVDDHILVLLLKAIGEFTRKFPDFLIFLEEHPERLLAWLYQVQKWLFLIVEKQSLGLKTAFAEAI
jgi:hypothetical protein